MAQEIKNPKKVPERQSCIVSQDVSGNLTAECNIQVVEKID